MLHQCLWRALVCRHRLLGSKLPLIEQAHHKATIGSLAGLGSQHGRSLAIPKAYVLVSAKQNLCTSRCWLQVREQKSHNKPVSLQTRSEGVSPQTTTQKVKEAGRDFTYFIVVLIGIGVTGGLFYVVFKELFSSSSPSKIYGDALERCRSHPEVIGVFGEPIKGYGETTRRGRRQHVSHIEYVKDGLKCMRLKFYIQGSEARKQGTVHLEVKENPENGKYEFQYIFVEIDTYPRRTIVIEDNRHLPL
ncbi:mitochondrial import inner membrane translocase subunit Tim21 [Pelobates cultripes]|uniref:Mitochondrial import inner membrane translocase subunit Tim21 n=1 Tax=Pelobates cultripes TaxID=61616 RepID=A0AAD1W2Y4_PELCU|nr:mitochondrial import inner membrane translocase subunit Tim21 [Pelobates cultripes]